MAILNPPTALDSPSTLGQSYLYLLRGDQWNAATQLFSTQEIRDKMTYLFSSPYEVIRSLRVYPFDLNAYASQFAGPYNLKLGFAEFPSIGTVSRINEFSNVIDLGQIEVVGWADNFLDYAPYTQMQLYLPYIGFVKIDPKAVLHKWLHVYYVVDYTKGTVQGYAVRQETDTPGADDYILSINEGVIALDIPVLSNNAASLANQARIADKQASSENAVTAATTAVATTAAIVTAIVGIVTGGAGAIVGGVAGAVGSLAGGAAKAYRTSVSHTNAIASLESHFGATGVPAGISSWYAPQRAMLYKGHVRRWLPQDFDKIYGRPLEATRDLSALSGYTEVKDIHLHGFDNATDAELKEVELLLKTGVYL